MLLKFNRSTTVKARSNIVRPDAEADDVTGSGSSSKRRVSVATATTRRRGRDETTGIRIRGGVRVAVLNPSAEQSQAGSRKEGRVSLLRSVMLLLREESNAEC